jgi:hypothetical protein
MTSIGIKRLATVLYDYESTSETELEAKQGEQLIIINDEDVDWICVAKEKQPKIVGYIPRDYIQEVKLKPPVPQSKPTKIPSSFSDSNTSNASSTKTNTTTTTSNTSNSNNNNNNNTPSWVKKNEVTPNANVGGIKSNSNSSSSSNSSNTRDVPVPVPNNDATPKKVAPPVPAKTTTTASSTTSSVNSTTTTTNSNSNDSSNTRISELRKSLFSGGINPLNPAKPVYGNNSQSNISKEPVSTTTEDNNGGNVKAFAHKIAAMQQMQKNLVNKKNDTTTTTTPRKNAPVEPQQKEPQKETIQKDDKSRVTSVNVPSSQSGKVAALSEKLGGIKFGPPPTNIQTRDIQARETTETSSPTNSRRQSVMNYSPTEESSSPPTNTTSGHRKSVNPFSGLQNMLKSRPKSVSTYAPIEPYNGYFVTGKMNQQESDACILIEAVLHRELKLKRLRDYLGKDPSLKDARIRKNLLQEIFTTEVSYVSALQTIKEKFLEPITNKKMLKEDELIVLFGPVDQVLNVHKELLASMEEQMKNSLVSPTAEHVCIGKVIARIAPFLKLYTEYVNNFDAANVLYEKLMQKNKRFANYVDKQTADSVTLPGYLIQPVQRIPRIRLLLEDLIRRTPESHIDYPFIQKAYTAILDIATFINEHKRQSDHSQSLRQVQSRLDPNILLPHRRCVFAGSVTALIETTTRCDQTFSAVAQNFEQDYQRVRQTVDTKVVMRQKQLFKIFVFNDLCFLVDDPNNTVDQRYNSNDSGIYLCYLLFASVTVVSNQDDANPIFRLDTIFKGENMVVTIYSTSSSIGTAMTQDQRELLALLQQMIEQTRKSISKLNVQEDEFDNMLLNHLELIHKIPKRTSELSHIKDKKRDVNKRCIDKEARIAEKQRQIEELQKQLLEEQQEYQLMQEDVSSLSSYESYITDEYKKDCQDKLKADDLLKNALYKDSYAYNMMFVPKIWRGKSEVSPNT